MPENGDRRHFEEIDFFSQRLGIDNSDELYRTWRSFAGRTIIAANSTKRAHRADLGLSRPVNESFREFWNSFLRWLARIVDLIGVRYERVYAEVTELFAGGLN